MANDERKDRNDGLTENNEAPQPVVETDAGLGAPSASVAVGSQVFELPCGVLLNGVVHRTVELTPLTSGDRKTVMDGKVRRNSGKIITSLLSRRVKRIGDLPPSEVLIRKMLAPDRDYCVLMVGKMTIGNTLSLNSQCPYCQSDLDIDVEADKIDIRRMSDEDYANVTDKGEWFFESRILDKYTARFRWPTGEITENIGENAGGNPMDAEFRLLAKMMLSWNGGKPLALIDYDNLPLPVLDAIEEAIVKNAKGPDLSPMMKCETCGKMTRLQIDLTDFLFRNQLKRNRLQRP